MLLMKFSCEKAILQTAVTTAGRVVAPKSTIQALEGVLLETENDRLQISGYNLETGIVTHVEAEVRKPGAIVLSARLLGEILRRMPDDAVSVTSDADCSVHIQCGPTSFDIKGSNDEDFPELPSVNVGSNLVVTQGDLRSMIAQTIFAVSDNESRPIHTGALFETDNGVLTMVAVDGYRLALRREKLLNQLGDGLSFVVPGAALNEVEKICADSDDTVIITQGDRHVLFSMGDTLLVARRLEGEFLNYRQTIPKNNAIILEAEAADLQRSIDRASLIINDKLKSPLRCKFEDGTLSITSKTAIGAAFDRCPITGDGKGLEIGFNNRFLMDAVKAAPASRVRLELNTATSPCLVLPLEGEKDNFLYMVLPVRLRAGE